jgi:exocyst complex component 4
MLDGVRKKQQFTFDEYKTMFSLKCGVDEMEGDAGVAKATDRNYTMYLIDLHGFELESPSAEVKDS